MAISAFLFFSSVVFAQEWQFVSGEYNGVVFGDGGEIVVVGESGIILRSGDGGKTWTMPKSRTYHTLRDVAFLGEGAYLAVGDGGTMLRSEDGGENWFAVESGTAVELKELAVVEGGRVFVLGSGGELYRSDNGGAEWTALSALPEGAEGFAFLDDEIGVIAGLEGGIYRTSDGGMSWIEVYRDTALSFLDAAFASGTMHGVVSGQESVVMRTADAGLTWEPDSVEFPLDGISIVMDANGRAMISGVGKQYPAKAMVGRSLDWGATWEPVAFPYPQDISECRVPGVALGENGRQIALMNVGCIYRTENDWEAILPVTQLQYKWADSKVSLKGATFGTGQVGVIPGGSGGYLHTSDGGVTWLAGQIGGVTHTAADFFSETGAFMVRQTPDAMVRTLDGGETWQGWSPETEAGFGYTYRLQFLDSLYGFQAGTTDIILENSRGFFYRTTDGAATFHGREFDHPRSFHLLQFLSPDVGWIGGGNPTLDMDSIVLGYEYAAVYKTTDGGETWGAVYDRYGVYVTPLFMRFRNEQYGVMAVGGAEYGYPNEVVLLETTDGGDAWSVKARFPQREAPSDLVFMNDTLWYAVGGRASIWETTDAGETWRREEIDPLPQDRFGNVPPFNSIVLLPDERTVIASGQSILVRRVFPEKVTGVEEEQGKEWRAVTALPNPAADVVRVRAEGGTTALVYDLSGRVVMRQEIGPEEGGSVELTISPLPSGVYRVVVRDAHRQIIGTVPLVILR